MGVMKRQYTKRMLDAQAPPEMTDVVALPREARGLCSPRLRPFDADQLRRVRTWCDRCGSRTFIETPIHAGKSLRRDCARCKYFLGWPTWYGRNCEE